MENVFVSDILINKVRHLENLEIPLSYDERKHLIITGKNGSGKTSLLNSISEFLSSVTSSDRLDRLMRNLKMDQNNLESQIRSKASEETIIVTKKRIENYEEEIKQATGGIILKMNRQLATIHPLFKQGTFIVAYYRADRVFKADIPRHVEKVKLKNDYAINETPRTDFVKYLLDLKMTEALAIANGNNDKADKIKHWFEDFQNLLRLLFEDDSLCLKFDEETFAFSIRINGKEPFDFNTLSSGYAAVMDIVVDLIIRMEKHLDRVFDFSIPGIVLIDEIETHLHLEMQRKILRLLTTIFPNIQFIVSTHSPFILNSLDNVVIYDLENRLLVENGLAEVPYAGIVEGYFNADEMSVILREKYERYRKLAEKQDLTDDDLDEIAGLELYLDEIPDYLALEITTEYQRLKHELRKRYDG